MDSSKTVKVVLTLDNGQYITSLQASGREHSTFAANVVRSGQAMDATLKSGEMSAKQTAAALRMLPAQFTDIFTGLASGQAPMTVLIQQGGQLKDSFGGVAPAARAMGGYIAGLVSPTMLAAGAAGALAAAYYQGSKEADAYTRSIVMSGNAAGASVGQMQAAARGASAVVGTQAAAADAVAQLGATGQVAARNLEGFTATALRMEREVGQAVEKTAEQFASLGDKPVQASLKLNDSYGYLTTAIYEQIRALETSGKHQEAAELAQRSFANAMDERTNRLQGNLGLLERGWRAIGDAAGWAWNKMLNIGRKETVADQLSKAQQELQDRMSRGPLNDVPGVRASWEKGNEALRQRIAYLSETVRMEARGAEAEAQRQAQEKAGIEWSQRAFEARSKSKKMEDELAAARQQFKDAGKDEVRDKKELDTVLAGIRDKYKESTTEQNKAVKEQERQLALMAELGGLSSTFYKDWTELNKQFAAGKIKQEELVRLQATLLAKQPAMAAAAREEQKALDAQVQAWQELERVQERAREKALEALQKSAQAAEQQVQKLLDEEHATTLAAVANISLAEAVERVALARAQDAYQKAAAAGADGQTLLALQKEIEAREKIVSLTGAREAREALKKTADEAGKELKRVTEQYEQGLTNAAMQGGKSLKEYIQGVLRTTAFRIVLQPVMNWGAQLLTAITGGGAAGASALLGGGGGGGSGGAMGLLNGASTLNTAYNLFNGGIASSLGAGVTQLGTMFGNQAAMQFGMGMQGMYLPPGMMGPGVYSSTGAMGAAAGTAVGIGAGVLGGIYGGRLVSGGFSMSGNSSGNSAVNTGTAVGAAVGSIIPVIGTALGALIGGLLGGAFNRAFGYKLKDSGLEATLGSNADGGSESRLYEFYKGGWFKSDKTEYSQTDPNLEKFLDGAVMATRASLKSLAEAFDLPTVAIDTFGLTIKESFKGLDEEETNQKIAEIIERYATGVSEAFIKGFGEVPDWIDRIAKSDGAAADKLKAIAEMPNQLLQAFGTSRDALVQTFAQGLVSGDAMGAGQAVADQLVASIEATMLGSAAGRIFDIMNSGLITPILDAVMTGATVSEALSEASIQRTIAKAQEAAAAFAAVWNDPEFKSIMETIRTGFGSALGDAGAAMQYQPRYIKPAQDLAQAADAASKAAEDAKKKWEDIWRGLRDARFEADVALLRAMGQEEAALAKERARAIEDFDAEQTAYWDATQAILRHVDALQVLRELHDEQAQLQVALLRAQGDESGAALREFQSATEKMTDAQREAYRVQQQLNESLRAQIAWTQELPGVLDKFRTPEQRTAAQYDSIAGQLIGAGLGVDMGQGALAAALTGATKDEILELASALIGMGEISEQTRLVLVRTAGALADLKDAEQRAAEEAARAATGAADGIVKGYRGGLDGIVKGLEQEQKRLQGAMVGALQLTGAEYQQFGNFAEQIDRAAEAMAELQKLDLGDAFEGYASQIRAVADETERLLAAQLSHARLMSGDAQGALAASTALGAPKLEDYFGRAGFVAGDYNRALSEHMARAAGQLLQQASADALRIPNAGAAMGALIGPIIENQYASVLPGIRADIRQELGGMVGGLLSGVADELARMDTARRIDGPGLAGVLSASMGRANLQTVQLAYEAINSALANGRISAEEAAKGIAYLDAQFGALKDSLGSLAQQAAAAADQSMRLSLAGVEAVAHYFDSLGAIAQEMTQADQALAATARTIGLMQSAADAFGGSARAALDGASQAYGQYSGAAALSRMGLGGDGPTAEQYDRWASEAYGVLSALQDPDSQVSRAALVGESAALAASIMTTASAAQAAKDLAGKLTLKDGQSMRDLSMLVGGVGQYDNERFYSAFARLSDALGKGDIDSEQYKTLFGYLKDSYEGADKTAQAFERLRDAMRKFGDELLIGDKTTLDAQQTLAEVQRQYTEAVRAAGLGDQDAIGRYTDLAGRLLDKDRYSTQAEYNAVFGRVYGDARALEAQGVQVLANAQGGVAAELRALNTGLTRRVEELEKNLVAALAQIAKNTAATSRGVQQQNVLLQEQEA